MKATGNAATAVISADTAGTKIIARALITIIQIIISQVLRDLIL
jgi:hypothetical protein